MASLRDEGSDAAAEQSLLQAELSCLQTEMSAALDNLEVFARERIDFDRALERSEGELSSTVDESARLRIALDEVRLRLAHLTEAKEWPEKGVWWQLESP